MQVTRFGVVCRISVQLAHSGSPWRQVCPSISTAYEQAAPEQSGYFRASPARGDRSMSQPAPVSASDRTRVGVSPSLHNGTSTPGSAPPSVVGTLVLEIVYVVPSGFLQWIVLVTSEGEVC